MSAFLAKRIYESPHLLVSWSVFALAGGVLFEFRRITSNLTLIFWSMAGALAFSLIAFIPGEHERVYSLESHIQMWPYLFSLILAIFAAISEKEKVTARMDEGWTLLLTLAFLYWAYDMEVLNVYNTFGLFLLAIIGVFSLYAIVNAFLPITMSKRNRLWLSIWSSLVMVVLALDNFRRVYGLDYAAGAKDRWSVLLVVMNYFLVGMSSIYLVQNVFMLMGFIPQRDQTGLKTYRKDLAKLEREHVDRYSDRQVDPWEAVLCTFFACGIFGLNLYYQVVRSNFAIWMVFLFFPRILRIVYPRKVEDKEMVSATSPP